MSGLLLDDIKKQEGKLYHDVLENRELLKEFLRIQDNKKKIEEFKKIKESEYQSIIKLSDDVNNFIDNIEALSGTVNTLESYMWLCDIAEKWHSIFSTLLSAPRIIDLSPPNIWLEPPSANFTDKEIEDRLKTYKDISCSAQKAEFHKLSDEHEQAAYRSAKEFFVLEVLDGKINFAQRIPKESYWRLEEIWVKQLKSLLAYFFWMNQQKVLFQKHETDFLDATNYLRNKLVTPEIKAQPSEFKIAKDYIRTHYINEDNKLREFNIKELNKLLDDEAYNIYKLTGYEDENKNWKLAEVFIKGSYLGRCSSLYRANEDEYAKNEEKLIEREAYRFYKITGYTDIDKNGELAKYYVKKCRNYILPDNSNLRLSWLIREKARRIFETTGSTDEEHNWFLAQTYVKMFYESIVPAVEEDNKEKVLRVLKAFQYCKTSGFLIKNCFELAIAIYFLNPQTINSLWEDAKSEPETNVESIVLVKSWPQNFTVNDPCKTRFWINRDRNIIGFYGVMMDDERKALLTALQTTSERPTQEHINAIQTLYDQSRIIHKNTTL